ncbi:hypothetical protein BFP77_00065 [Maribacter sp. 4U21]|uniref:CPBP family intramembrane glutamic endopeptidase n=1 Tax=Maribacter sp. 4U21 TaxID=1889779 RepID=UPI000C14A67A|nr:CPBP family intramembrane glutamic endopeptidase [Maribacter sp. 4U21]PIB28371.1 hypothetical protein BFP77_00065 [Maribacter sp. 4U21]
MLYKVRFSGFVILILTLLISYFSSFFALKLLFSVFTFEIYSKLAYTMPAWIFSLGVATLLLPLLKLEHKKKITIPWLLQRLRLKKFVLKEFVIAISLFIASLLIEVFLRPFFDRFFILYKRNLSGFDEQTAQIELWVLAILFIGVFFGSVLEELLWRGYLLPIQEKTIGRYAWLLNGILWSLSHIFIYNPITILFSSICLSFIAFKYKNITYTIILHLLLNAIVYARYV